MVGQGLPAILSWPSICAEGSLVAASLGSGYNASQLKLGRRYYEDDRSSFPFKHIHDFRLVCSSQEFA
jgi:hypothetical protein